MKKLKRIAMFTLALFVLIASAFVTAYAAERDRKPLPVLMYHSVLDDSAYLGKYVISPEELREDLEYLKAEGYVTVSLKELLAYADGQGNLPEKPVLLSFDDGYYNNYLYAFPLLKDYGAKAVISPIGKYADEYSAEDAQLSPYYSHATWEQLKEMWASGLVELGNHSYNLHKSDGLRLGVKKLPGEDDNCYRNILSEDIGRENEKLKAVSGEDALCFAYPFGAVSPETPEIISSLGFKLTLSCEEKLSFVKREESSLIYLGRFLRSHGRSAEEILCSLNT